MTMSHIQLFFILLFQTMSPKRRKVETCTEVKSRSGKYLQKLNVSDPEKYKKHLEKEAARNKRMRGFQKEKIRLRVQKLR